MKANPGGTLKGEAIIGRESEIAKIWNKLEKRSVVLTAERRVGKTCVLRKMAKHPREGWIPIFCWLESSRHPIDCVEVIYSEASRLEVPSQKGKWLARIRTAYKTITGAEVAGWRFPQIQSDWKRLLNILMKDIVENTENRVLVILDEFPLMVANIIDDHKPSMGMQFLDAMREIRQRYEPSNQVRFLLSGSIGLHLILKNLKAEHGYKGNPNNNTALESLSGMNREDSDLMCRKYLDEEGIKRNSPSDFDKRMFHATDGLPLYIQYVCEEFQDSGRDNVSPDDIDKVLRQMIDSTEIEWFTNAVERIDTYYSRLGADRQADHILTMLSIKQDYVPEKDIIDYVRSQMVVEHDRSVLSTLELLRKDHYLVRNTSKGRRRYRFKYNLMRKWWKLNRS